MAHVDIPKLDVDHPKVREMRELGITGNHLLRTTLIYLDLCEGQEWCGVKVHYSQTLGRAFLSGYATPLSPRQLVLPVDSSEVLSHEILRSLLDSVKLDCDTSESRLSHDATLAICDPDSTLTYYTISDGLTRPSKLDALPPQRQKPTLTTYKHPLDPTNN